MRNVNWVAYWHKLYQPLDWNNRPQPRYHNSNGLKGPYNLLHFPFACILTLISERILYAVAYTINQSPSEKTQTGAVAKNSYSKISRLAPSVTRVAICVSRVLLDGLQKKRETARSLRYSCLAISSILTLYF